ncbi:MAG: TIGR00730 family Rossman fold protein [Rhodobiaceae bacterium]|nr:TIGR00730 family Rossman fold protein [Rhodobiaceae bacterium]
MSTIESICVYCGSAPGARAAYTDAAVTLGRAMAAAGVRLVYGGGSTGLMGEVARATLAAGGKVTGIIPQFLVDREVMLRDVDDLIITEDMHERKRLMFERSDAFVALPGGIGTLEETVEMLTWLQLGRHMKPVVVANIDGFWRPFSDLIAHMEQEGFIREGMDVVLQTVDRAEDLLPAVQALASRMPEADQRAGAASLSNL